MRNMRSATVFLTIFTIVLGTVPSTGRILLVVGDESTTVLVISSAQQLDLDESTIDSILSFLFTFPFPSRIRTLLSCEVGSREEPWASALSLSLFLLSSPLLSQILSVRRRSIAWSQSVSVVSVLCVYLCVVVVISAVHVSRFQCQVRPVSLTPKYTCTTVRSCHPHHVFSTMQTL